MESKAHATIAGAFVVIMIAMVICVVLWFSKDKTVRVPYDIVTTSSVNGIAPQASVQLQGINVGVVESVEFLADQPDKVRIRMQIDEQAPITRSTYAVFNYRGVTGLVYIELMNDLKSPTDQRGQPLYTDDTSGVPQIPLQANTLQSFAETAQGVLTQAEDTLKNLNSWLSKDNEQTLFSAVESIGQAADQVSQLSRTLDTKMDRVMTDASSTLSEVRSLAHNADKMVSGLVAPGGAIENIVAGTQALAGAADHLNAVTLPRIDQAARSADRMFSSLKRFLQRLDGQPQSLIFGYGQPRPGPGEAGFESPYSSQRGNP